MYWRAVMAEKTHIRLQLGFVLCVALFVFFSSVYPVKADDCKRVQNIVVLFDASGFMKQKGRYAFLIKQMRLFEKAMPLTMDGFFKVGLRDYGFRVGTGCASTESILAVQPWDPERFLNSFPVTVSYGTSALSAGLRGAAEDLADASGKSIILVVGGGLESCKADPLKIADRIAFNNPDLEIHTMQIGREQEGKFFLSGIAKRGRGTYAVLSDSASPAQWHSWMIRYLVEPCQRPEQPEPAKQLPSFGAITFDYKSNSVRSKDRVANAQNLAALAGVSAYLKKNPTHRLIIHGFTDGKGSQAYNLKLSNRRAAAVARYLTKTYGIPAAQMSIVGHGMSQTLLQQPGAAMSRAARRVEFEIEQ
jgi:outer membrane protein OmpA-like peptidoglycan-associated protein